MDKDLLQKHQNDPAWAEVVRLYSGLFDTQDEREDFILDLADKDILLAAECKTSSVEEESFVKSKVADDAENIAKNFKNTKDSSKAFLALLELYELKKIINILMSVYTAKKEHREVLKLIIERADSVSKKIDFIDTIISFIKQKMKQPKQKTRVGSFLYWSIPNFKTGDSPLSNNDISKIESICSFLENQEQYISLLNLIVQLNIANKIYDQRQLHSFLSKLIKRNKFLEIHHHIKELGLIDVFTPLQAFNNALKEGTIYYIETCLKINELYNLGFSKEAILDSWIEVHNKFVPKKRKRIREQIIRFADENNIRIDLEIISEKSTKKSEEYVDCQVSNIISSRVFVKIENEPRSTSIYIGELSNKRIENIFDFEYNGEKLHVGQKLIAKIISIDEQGKINLSLKQMKNG